MNRSRPQARQIHEHEQPRHRAQTRIVRVREQSMSAFSPRTVARQRTVHEHSDATALTVHEHRLAADLNCPPTGRSREQSTSAHLSRTGIARELGQARKCPKGHIAIAISPPTIFPVHIRIIPAYAIV
jgi:hypothetical protein